jgi:sugar lactone lactonase YvrE
MRLVRTNEVIYRLILNPHGMEHGEKMNMARAVNIGYVVVGILGFAILSNAADTKSQVHVVVGHLLPKEGGTQPASASPLRTPFGVDFDAAGNMWIVELTGGRVHRIDTGGKLTHVSGDGSKSYRGDGEPANKATFNGMHNVAVTPEGDVYISDSWNHCIRKIDKKTGAISTIAGTGKAGFSGDGGPATKARFNFVMCITFNAAHDKLYVADLKNRRIRVVDLKTGLVDTIAGNGKRGVPTNGADAKASPLVDPRAVAVDSKGRVYILERGGHALRVVSPAGKIRTVAGTGKAGRADGPALSAQLNGPKHLCFDAADNVYIADEQNRLIKKYDPRKKTLTTVLGDGKSNPPVRLSRPHGVCVRNGQLYIVDTGNNRVLRMSVSGSK